jgi:hypothetical protein
MSSADFARAGKTTSGVVMREAMLKFMLKSLIPAEKKHRSATNAQHLRSLGFPRIAVAATKAITVSPQYCSKLTGVTNQPLTIWVF